MAKTVTAKLSRADITIAAQTGKPIPVVFVQEKTDIPAQLTVDAVAFKKWRLAEAKASAAKHEAEALRQMCGFPDTKGLALLLGVPPAVDSTKAAIIIDASGVPLGKVSVWWKAGFEMPASYSARVS